MYEISFLFNNTPLHEAIKRNDTKIIKLLIANEKIDLNATDKAFNYILIMFIFKSKRFLFL